MGLVGTVLQREVEIEPNMKLECVPKFYHLSDTPVTGGVDQAASARVRYAWAKFKDYRQS